MRRKMPRYLKRENEAQPAGCSPISFKGNRIKYT
jgi:hypothetical protein